MPTFHLSSLVIPQQPFNIYPTSHTSCLSRPTLASQVDNIVPHIAQNLLRHALALDAFPDFRRNRVDHTTREALEVDAIAVCHFRHGGRGVDVCAVGRGGGDGGDEDLMEIISKCIRD
jgi:hypothetical protein